MSASLALEERIEIAGPMMHRFGEILTPEALAFAAKIQKRFDGTREELLERRVKRQSSLDQGVMPRFLSETSSIRSGDWKISPTPTDLQDRRVEITGPAGDTKMVINALNSGANVYMADFEDAQSPTWHETIQGQINLIDAINGVISYTSPEGKKYSLAQKVATLIVRPRGLHLLEKHVLIDDEPFSASIFDFSLFAYHNARKLLEKGSGPYLYLPKMESHLEARFWNEIFVMAEKELELPRGAIKATVLIETILAAFEMEEILYELRDHCAGLNCGRWDYIFSFIKKFRGNPDYLLPDRAVITMDKGFLKAYVDLLIETCHKRGAHAIGGMSAFIPIKGNEKANTIALEKVRQDKLREVKAGHDGTWVAHPGLVQVAREVFDQGMPSANQIHLSRERKIVNEEDLLAVPRGNITEEGIRTNISVGIQYLEAWLRGKGSVPINNLMEDAATAEICRAQLWQWLHHGARMADGGRVIASLVRRMMGQELERLESQLGEERFYAGQYQLASEIFGRMLVAEDFPEFLTLVAYEHLIALERGKEGKKS